MNLKQTLQELNLGAAQAFENMTMTPLFRNTSTGAPFKDVWYLTLDEAAKKSLLTIEELPGGGSVPEIQVTNRADKPVLLVDGDELLGAKQNRVFNLTILVPANCTLRVPVSCVEAGRWAARSSSFQPAPHMMFAGARASKMVQVSASLDRSGRATADQQDVWNVVAHKSASMFAPSPTSAMSDIFDRHAQGIDRYASAFHPALGQVGAMVCIDGQVAGLDLFDVPATFAALCSKLMRGYILDAVETAGAPNRPQPSPNAVHEFLGRLENGHARAFPSVGIGEAIRIDGNGVVGAALVVDGTPVHLSAFERRHGRR